MTDTDPAGGYRNDDGGRDGISSAAGGPPGTPGEQRLNAPAPTERRGPVPVFGAAANPDAVGPRPAPSPFSAPAAQHSPVDGYQGQGPQGAGPWGNAGYAQNPYGRQGPAGAGPYPLGPPRKGGMPTWGWVLIGAGVLVLGAIGILFTLFVVGLASGVSSVSETSEPFSVPEYTSDGAPGGPAGGTAIDAPVLQPLDVSASFVTPPSWALPEAPWALDDTPAEGTYFFSSADGCDMILEQAYMPPALEGEDDLSSDALATQSYLTYLAEYFADLEGGTSDGTAGSVPVSINFPGGPTMDLGTTTLPGLTLDGAPGVRHMATRAMPASGGVVSTIITCPQTVLDADPAYFAAAVAGLYILPTP